MPMVSSSGLPMAIVIAKAEKRQAQDRGDHFGRTRRVDRIEKDAL